MSPRIGSLCTGYGGLDMAVEEVFGARTVWHAEHEPATEKNPRPPNAAARLLEYRCPGRPNHGDITSIDWSQVEPVDMVTAGYPCQPESLAGKGLSEDDERWIWPDVARAISALGPRLVVLENVGGHLVRGFRTVLGSLADLGYDARWTVVRASDVGAPHERKRIFVLAQDAFAAHSDDDGRQGHISGGHEPQEPATACDAVVAADAQSNGRNEGRPESAGQLGRPDAAERRQSAAADAVRERLAGDQERDGEPDARQDGERGHDADRRSGADFGPYQAAVERWERVLGRPAPAPTMTGQRGARVLSPLFVEWMMGLPTGWVTDAPGISRNDQLKMLGNGVVPQQAATALRALLDAETVAA